jgi:phenylpropionate dioxygenase-like ring-hydroxylating dioxygenase large terminal subunit
MTVETERPTSIPLSGPRRLPDGTRLTGWYQIGWSWTFPAGAPPVQLRYFGRELVAYRTEGSEMVVANAYCPHLGAHLGHGGYVRGECLVCPFHGWEWNSDGTNRHIPYGPRTSVRNRLVTYPVREIDDHIVMWYDPEGREPFLDCHVRLVASDAELLRPDEFSTHHFAGVAMTPQLPVENLVDFAHFKYVHQAEVVGGFESVEEIDGRLRATLALEFGGGRSSTWLTPDGPVRGHLVSDIHSVGFFVSRFEVHEPGRADMMLTIGTTPVDGTTSDLFVTITARDPEIAHRWVEQEVLQGKRDLRIWENLTYQVMPPLVGDEGPAMRALRSWTYQFYSTSEQR